MNKSNRSKRKTTRLNPDEVPGAHPDGAGAARDDLGIMQPDTEQIAKLAYQFYVEDGKPEGCADDHWLRAEAFLVHPEIHSDENVLAVPSEPEITRALDEKAKDLDQFLPSDPHSGSNAMHQRIEIAVDSRAKNKSEHDFRMALKNVKGVERIVADGGERMTIHFDARRTNPAAIHEALFGRDEEELDGDER